MPSLVQIWRLYLRRFAIDHWNRFAKQRLHWTLPHFVDSSTGFALERSYASIVLAIVVSPSTGY
ncbi:hypothetical protein Pse7429DRAFT_0038 [Pseudanabaena biceps PCC 7429]|uniref:Uncharacterized protein n=1 Tax=Pseudanabaena biceps PCC 7429 TaxID=927668 RepID=L8N6W7_9CYAN|nr:hypothetical protein Pse7429DRAFT_0038 [Pseudanabaena biceps PCC 7429]